MVSHDQARTNGGEAEWSDVAASVAAWPLARHVGRGNGGMPAARQASAPLSEPGSCVARQRGSPLPLRCLDGAAQHCAVAPACRLGGQQHAQLRTHDHQADTQTTGRGGRSLAGGQGMPTTAPPPACACAAAAGSDAVGAAWRRCRRACAQPAGGATHSPADNHSTHHQCIQHQCSQPAAACRRPGAEQRHWPGGCAGRSPRPGDCHVDEHPSSGEQHHAQRQHHSH